MSFILHGMGFKVSVLGSYKKYRFTQIRRPYGDLYLINRIFG